MMTSVLGFGMSAGPFFGGLLTKINTSNTIFNGYTSPEWIMAIIWGFFWICVYVWFEDVEDDSNYRLSKLAAHSLSLTIVMPLDSIYGGISSNSDSDATLVSPRKMTASQWGVIVCMCWLAMTCFFVLGMTLWVPSVLKLIDGQVPGN